MTTPPPLPLRAIAALQDLSDALWRNVHLPKDSIRKELHHADNILRQIRKQYVRPAVLDALAQINPKIQLTTKP